MIAGFGGVAGVALGGALGYGACRLAGAMAALAGIRTLPPWLGYGFVQVAMVGGYCWAFPAAYGLLVRLWGGGEDRQTRRQDA